MLPVQRDRYRGLGRLCNPGSGQRDSRHTEVSAELPSLPAKGKSSKERTAGVTHAF